MRENLRKNVMRRRAKLIRERKAVSPVVATLILILVAVAAAAALYLWLVAWQGGVTGNIGSPTAQYTVTIGGSTSVYPFTQIAATQFEQNNSNIVLSVNQGGTGAGMLAVCHGAVDIGEASSLQTLTGLETSDGCPDTAVINVVAYDAVDIILPVANPHGIISMSQDTLLSIYVASSTSAPNNDLAVGGGAYTINGYAPATAIAQGTPLEWQEIPACAAGPITAPFATCDATTFEPTTGFGAATGTAVGNDLTYPATGPSPCGWTVCAGGTTANPATDNVIPTERSDTSGTEQTFTAKLLGISGTTQTNSLTTLANSFTGCGSDGQLASCGISEANQESGNPAVISWVASHADGIGFASDGLARATGSGVTCAGSGTFGGCVGLEAVGQSGGAVVPSLGSSGTIANAIKGVGATNTQYVGWRPFSMVTTNTPTGEVERFIQYVLDPANNQNFATEAAEISIYSI